jgi:phage baseplate assembly protein W
VSDAILGRGWAFPIRPDATGRLGYSEADDNVESSLRVLLQTALGERVMRPTFGCGASDLVFAPGSQASLGQLETAVREAVRDWEPRVILDDVQAEPDPQQPAYVNVSVSYRVRRTNTPNNLVFPFYLARAGAG